MSFDYFGTVTNLSISLAVTVYGLLAWAREHSSDLSSSPFRRCAYLCWWASWLSWSLAWATILVAGICASDSLYLRIPVLVFDNLNSVFLILIFLTITRGDAFGTAQIRLAFAWIVTSLGGCTLLLYFLSRWLGLSFAYEVHRTWALCLSVISPILVGWAFNLRFNTLSALAVGFVYGFIQPVVYSTEIHAPGPIADAVERLRPVTAMTLAGLKVTWAIVFMQVLALGVATGSSLVEDKPLREFKLFKGWTKKLAGQAITLVVLYTILLVWMFVYYVSSLEKFAVALGIVGGIIALLDWFWKLWEKASKHFMIPQPPVPPAG